jgi:4-amino-4-deoxy-L-arabinose transferase-like glycosyltransferase
MTSSLPSIPHSALRIPHLSMWLMIVVLLIAALFRFFAIDSAPPGWRDDELIEFGMDQRIVQGWRPLFISEAEGHEPVYHYLHAGTIVLFGENIIGYKWLPFAFGLLTIALTFALARRMFDARVGLLAAALMAVSFWPIMYSRLGIRHIGLLPWMLGAFYLLYPSLTAKSAEGAEKRKIKYLRVLGGGICLAAGLMTYFAGRAVPIILIGFLIYLLLFNRSILRRVWLPIGAAIAIGGLIALPMFIQIAQTPGSEKRTEVVGGPLIELSKGNLKPAIETTLGTLGMFTFAGDPESLYNVSGRPVFDWITGIFFYLGVLLSLMRLKRVENGFALAWLVIGLAPAFVSLPAGSFSHTIAALPVVFVFIGVGVCEATSFVAKLIARMRECETARISLSRYLAIALSVVLVGMGSWLTIRDYFGTWAHDDFVRFQYHAPTRDIAKWLDQNPDMVDVAIGTNPNELVLDPVALRLDLMRKDVRARWFSPESTFVLMPKGVLIVSAMQFLDSKVEECLTTSVFDKQSIRLNDIVAFDLYKVDLAHFMPSRTLGIFDGSIHLIASGPCTNVIQPGDQVKFETVWQIVARYSSTELKSFIHVLDSQNEVVAGDDRLDVNVSTLLPGDVIYQIGMVTLPATLEAGDYRVEVGLYQPDTNTRLLLPNGADHEFIQPLEVRLP